MIPYLQVESLTKSFGDRLLLDDVSFSVAEGDKIGIIAKNGSGKSTLLKIISGEEQYDSGKIVFRNDLKVGFLRQQPSLPDGDVIQSCMAVDSRVTNTIRRYAEAQSSGDSQLLASLSHEMDLVDGWDYEERLKQTLSQLGVTDFTQNVASLSGGQAKRIAIAQLILSRPDLIILDEPTNHLDIDVVEWLENYLNKQKITLIMVTHDRYFLERVCNKIYEIDRQKIYSYEGNYAEFIRRRTERIDAMKGELAKVKNLLRKEQEWMSRQPQARAGKARYRINAFYDLKERSHANYEEKQVSLDVKSSYIGSKIFEARHISKRFGDKVILDDFNYTFARYEKMGIIGANGVGKSTFIKLLQGILAPDQGDFDIGTTVRFGYYSQDGIKFDRNKKVIDAVTELAEDIVVNGDVHYSPMTFLQRFLFSVPDQQKYIHTLSGGELCRLHLAVTLMLSPNFLILDEPTNDLDIVTLGILEEYLRDFKGCLIVISHDRFFLDSIVDHLLVFEGGGAIKDFPGNYSEYREYRDNQLKSQAVTEPAKTEKRTWRQEEDRPRKLTFKERRELEQLTAEIDSLTAEKNSLDQLFASGENIPDIIEKSQRYDQIRTLLDEKELRWLELSDLE